MTDPTTLVCTTHPADVDPGAPPEGHQLTAFRSPRRELWGLGEAMRIELPAPWPSHVERVSETLAAIRTDDRVSTPGSGPVAFGALPFDRDSAATLLVPQVSFGRSAEGARWHTTVGPAGTDTSATSWITGAKPLPAELTVRSVEIAEFWCRAVEQATERIRSGELTKVVLAREFGITTDTPIDPGSLLRRLRSAYPAALCFAIDGFVGASPELLVSRVGDIVRAHPMAGTTARTGEPEADQRRAAELLSSAKNRSEHQITIDMVHDTLLDWCSFLDVEPTPSVVAAGPVQHLASIVEGRLSHPPAPVLELVSGLHPTPAVGGWPRDAAMRVIGELEPRGRGRYAGPVGWMDAAGNGAWAVGIRSVELHGTDARLFAGVGVVADSDPLAELEETRAKSQALLGAIVRL